MLTPLYPAAGGRDEIRTQLTGTITESAAEMVENLEDMNELKVLYSETRDSRGRTIVDLTSGNAARRTIDLAGEDDEDDETEDASGISHMQEICKKEPTV